LQHGALLGLSLFPFPFCISCNASLNSHIPLRTTPLPLLYHSSLATARPLRTPPCTPSATRSWATRRASTSHAPRYACRELLHCATPITPTPLRINCSSPLANPTEMYALFAFCLTQNPSYDYAGEVNALAAAVGNPSLAQASGIKAGGVKYMFIRSHVQDQSADPFLAGNKGGAGISVRQTKAVILVAISAPGAAGALLLSVFLSFHFLMQSSFCFSKHVLSPSHPCSSRTMLPDLPICTFQFNATFSCTRPPSR
jgi:hypothetical protein